MLSSQFVKGNVPDESGIVGGHLETASHTERLWFSQCPRLRPHLA